MQFCTEHWGALREAIDAQGLNAFVATSGEEVVEHMRRELSEEATLIDFEPLMGSHNVLLNIAMNLFGLEVMAPDAEGNHRCPACMLAQINWIEWVARGARTEAERRGLVEA